jgi:hypothetical protein
MGIIDMRHNRKLSYSAQIEFLAAVTHFLSIYDVTLNHEKIKKFMSKSEIKYKYRLYAT